MTSGKPHSEFSTSLFHPKRSEPTKLHSIRQYIEALEDPDGLTRTLGEISLCRTSAGEPVRAVGNSAVVFKIRCGRAYRMLKCYTRPMVHLDAIYGSRLLPKELYIWQADGSGEWCDVVTDDWIEGETLHDVVIRAAQERDKESIRQLAERFDHLALDLLQQTWAHGDLKPENILIDPEGELHLIDFDAMFLPSFAGEKSPELGTTAYQHPARTEDLFDSSLDDYPIALISTALHALVLQPDLLERYGCGDGLLLSPRQIALHRSPAYSECLALFEKRGLVARYRIARLLTSPLPSLPTLKALLEYAAEGVKEPCEDCELFVRDGYWGFRCADCEVIPPLYSAGFDFTEGVAAVQTGRTWHFIDRTGKVVIDCSSYEAVKPFSRGQAVVIKEGRRVTIDRSGKELLPEE